MKKNIVVTTIPQLSKYLVDEISELGYSNLIQGKTDVSFEGTFSDCMNLNLRLRLASRVLFEIHAFECANPDELYNEAVKIPWENYLFRDIYFSIDSFVRNETIRDTRYANLKLKDAVADRFYQKFGRRPDSGNERDKAVIYLHWVDTKASIYLDTSGETIAKHGYRLNPFKAPLLESLAAAILRAGNWTPDIQLINPMCGSGTIAIEAALIAMNAPPGVYRKNFAFHHYKIFERSIWHKLLSKAKSEINRAPGIKILASDQDARAIEAARENAEMARVSHLINFEIKDFKKVSIPKVSGMIILNPEYGERMGEIEKLEDTYSDIGTFLKTKCIGYEAFVLTGNMDLAKKIGLKTTVKQEFLNGKIDCRLLEFEIYKGSKRGND